ncbi:hypothetical protein ACTA71_007268 [Dictyostelium dimigraforme]
MNYLNIIKKINNKSFYSTTSKVATTGIEKIVIDNKDYLKSLNTGQVWELIVGIEVHAQTSSKQKLFSKGRSTGSMEGREANTCVDYFDVAFPGTLPVINKECVDHAISTGIALRGKINKESYFDRKHYFYQDLPQGYQITQYRKPLVRGGSMELELSDGRTHEIKITQIQLEQDSGKSIHDIHPTRTLVDLNRAGIGLMEIVSEPDFRSSEQVGCYIEKLQHLLRYIGSSNANMQFGEMRCDVNISIRKPTKAFGNRVELKNMISAKAIIASIDYEAKRQISILEDRGRVSRETRGFNPDTGETYHLRSKETEVDYRFFPEPDLPPLVIKGGRVEKLRRGMGELPDDLKKRLIKEYSITKKEAELIVKEKVLATFFEESLTHNLKVENKKRDVKKVLNFLLRDIFSYINSKNITDWNEVLNKKLTISKFTELLDLIEQGYITTNVGKTVLFELLDGENSGTSLKELIDSKGLSQISDNSILDEMIKKLVNDHPNEVTEYHQGKTRIYKYFMGEIMKNTKGRSDPVTVNDLLKKYLDLKKQ